MGMTNGRHWRNWTQQRIRSSEACVHSPDVAIHGCSAHDAVSDGDNAVYGLGLDSKAVTGGAEAVPVEDVDGPLAGATGHLLTPLHQRHRRQVAALVLRQEIEPPPPDVEDTHGAVAAAERM